MSDIRALLRKKEMVLSDGVYLEKLDTPVSSPEAWLRSLLARFSFQQANRTNHLVSEANQHEPVLRTKTDDQLRDELRLVALKMQRYGFNDELMALAFAIIREASNRVLGKRHHDVQLLAGQALLQGRIAEMATGEGKTLAATLAVCTAAMSGAKVHVVTVNDYLAERDAEENSPLYQFFNLSLGVVKQDMSIADRAQQYARHIVYVSNKELTFDYLKDRIALGETLASQLQLNKLQRANTTPQPILTGLHVAIIDEADSVLIDEARTPLIISETLPDDLSVDVYSQALMVAQTLAANLDYRLSHNRDIWLTNEGLMKVSLSVREFDGVWKSRLWQKELINKALSALYCFHSDQHYIVVENKVQIVDEFTGRVMPDRTWERGLHQMIEAKEKCEITGQRKTLSQVTYQRFFGRYLLLAGMTGTAKETAPELKQVYDLSVIKIPTHKATRRVRLADHVFATSDEKWLAIALRAIEKANEGRAVLIGTRSVEASERLSHILNEKNIPHATLNARQDKEEAEAVAQAGHSGRITVATNMAGRGTDIKLSPEVEALGGLHVILTEFHESARVDRQLFGRSARQGNPGTVEAIVSLEDELFHRYVTAFTQWGKPLWLGKTRCHRDLFRLFVWFAQSKAERQNRRARLDTLNRDRKWLESLGFVGLNKK
jgi:preprotein translocase subunit SecA